MKLFTLLLIAVQGISITTSWGDDIYISQVPGHGFSSKHGTAEAPYIAHSIHQLEKIVERVPDGSTLRFAKGVYPMGGLRVTNKSLTFQGSGDETILFSNKIGQNIIRFSGRGKSLCLKNLQIAYSGGWGDASAITVGVLVVPDALHGIESMDSILLDHVTFRDLYNAIYITAPLRSLKVVNCSFLYTHGRAGVSNKAPFQHPAVAVLGSGSEQTIVSDCYFDGLMDQKFSGVQSSIPQSQRTPMDGFYKAGGGNPKRTIIKNNIVIHHGIEGIICERMRGAGHYETLVESNTIIGPTYKERSFYGNYCPAIVIRNVQGAKVVGNTIRNSPMGVDVWFSEWADSNACLITQNKFRNVLNAARLTNVGSKTIFESNTVFCSSEPTKSVQDVSISWCGLTGVAASGNPVIRNNILQAMLPSWDAETMLLGRQGNVFTLKTTEGIVANQGVLIGIRSDNISYFPVQGIKGKNVTIAEPWAANQPTKLGESLVYARNFGNFTSLGAVCSFGSQSRVLCQSNQISGFVQDVATSNSGVVESNGNRLKDVHYVAPESHWIVRRTQ